MSESVNPSGARRKILLLAVLFALPMVVAVGNDGGSQKFIGHRGAQFTHQHEEVIPDETHIVHQDINGAHFSFYG
mgnify:CR=1 FL=1